jgi:hypothetical protein
MEHGISHDITPKTGPLAKLRKVNICSIFVNSHSVKPPLPLYIRAESFNPCPSPAVGENASF